MGLGLRLALALALLASSGGWAESARAGEALRFDWASAAPDPAFLDGKGGVRFEYKLRGSGTRDLRVDIVRVGSERVRSLELDDVPAGRRQSIGWNGLNVLGKPAKRGRYAFKVHYPSGKPVRLRKVRGQHSVDLYPFKFPVRGPHGYGGAEARFGAPRDGHSHQGQDVSASCGTKLVAPRGGKVQYRGYQGAAGNYLVLDLWHTGIDAVMMHLAKPAMVAAGDRVRTGQQLGWVGDTGDASGCHLHFELWSAPGWYQGGHPFDPLKKLTKWDSWS